MLTQPGPFKLNRQAAAIADGTAATTDAPTYTDIGEHDTSAISTISTPPEAAAYGTEEAEGTSGGWQMGEKRGSRRMGEIPREAVYPEDSILEDFVRFAREYSESEDAILVGAVLPLVARLLGRRVSIPFAGRKYPNLYTLLVTKPGMRKSTTIGLVERLGHALLPPNAFLSGATSEQAMFKQYQAEPDRMLIEEEGNTVLSNWAHDAAGKIVAKRFLRLYDCTAWQQDYIRQAEEQKDGQACQRIEATGTSLLIGTTFNNCRFNALETRDGLRRRVCYYVSDCFARTIYWPRELEGEAFERLAEKFAPLLELEGTMKLTHQAQKLWNDLQDRNRQDIFAITECDQASEAYGSALAEEQSRMLKLAMIFETCRWAADPSREWKMIQSDTLELAARHGRYCLEAGRALDGYARRSEIRERADVLLATIRIDFRERAREGVIELNRTELTHRFASNPQRHRALTPTMLYHEVIPDLIQRRLARELPKRGRFQAYHFTAADV
jgi:hypothetical protein